jgi:hypothetical protein
MPGCINAVGTLVAKRVKYLKNRCKLGVTGEKLMSLNFWENKHRKTGFKTIDVLIESQCRCNYRKELQGSSIVESRWPCLR